MFNPTEVVIDAFVRRLENAYLRAFGSENPGYPGVLGLVARTVLERIADTDALYHNIEHSIQVTLVGQEILRGKKIMCGKVDSNDWLHFVCSLLCHDVGYVRGICRDDSEHEFVVGDAGETIELPRGASDAALTDYHVDRGKIFVRERFADTGWFDVDRVAAAIELTRFPIPQDGDHDATDDEPGLVRAADLIGQLADPHYLRKINALFAEFQETGTAEKLAYATAADLAEGYPKFFWTTVRPYIPDALAYLRVTQEGKQWIANLYAHVFAVEHSETALGPERRDGG